MMDSKEQECLSQDVKKYISINDVRCPICEGVINSKWFNFRTGNIVEFIAECWTPNNPESPRHVFCFQIKIPDCVIISNEDDIE